MGMLGKDLLDYTRPLTHTRIRFGAECYWVEDAETPLPYGTILTELLNLDANDYFGKLDQLRSAIERNEKREAYDLFVEVVNAFCQLPLYNRYVVEYQAVERKLILAFFFEEGVQEVIQDIFAEDGAILKRYLDAEWDIRCIQIHYASFLEGMFYGEEPEKKKGQRKKSLAELIYEHQLEPYVSGRSLGADPEVDAPQVNVQYEVVIPKEGKTELTEKMYFDRLSDFVYVEFMKGMQKGFVPKRCRNCGKWFLQMPGATFAYCSDLAPGETDKTCRDIGAAASFHEKVKNNEIWQAHQRAYKKYYARVRKGTLSKADFAAWVKEAETLRDATLDQYESASPQQREELIEAFREKINNI